MSGADWLIGKARDRCSEKACVERDSPIGWVCCYLVKSSPGKRDQHLCPACAQLLVMFMNAEKVSAA